MILRKLGAVIASLVLSTGLVSAQSLPGGNGDWSGFYAGLSFSENSESIDQYLNGAIVPPALDLEGNGGGVFVGYLMQNGQYVYGGELAFSNLDTADPTGLGHSQTNEQYLDLKGRFGFAAGRALIYGILGYSRVTSRESAGNVDISTNGLNYGIGLDYLVSDRFFLGIEVLQRKSLEGDYGPSGFPGWTFETDSRSVTVRAGMTF